MRVLRLPVASRLETLDMTTHRRHRPEILGGLPLRGSSEIIPRCHLLAVVVNTTTIVGDRHHHCLKETAINNPLLHLSIGVATQPIQTHPIAATAGHLRDHRHPHSMIGMIAGPVNATCLHTPCMEGLGHRLVISRDLRPQGKGRCLFL